MSDTPTNHQNDSGAEPRLGLALGGGGARGLSHVGALQVFEEEGIPIAAVAGVSIGAIVAGLYALDPDGKSLEQRLRETENTPAHQRRCRQMALGQERFCSRGVWSRVYYALKAVWLLLRLVGTGSAFTRTLHRGLVASLVPDCDMAELKLPFAALAVDFDTTENVVLDSGNLREACTAGSAIPCIFPLERLDGRMLADATAVCAVPVQVAREHLRCDIVIAIDVGGRLGPLEELNRGHKVAARLTAILSTRVNSPILADAEIVIRPALEEMSWTDFSSLKEPLQAGRAAATAALPEIRAAIDRWRSTGMRQDRKQGIT